MRNKILTLLVNMLDKQEREQPTSAATRTGMEMAIIAVGTILGRLSYFNHRAELELQLAHERDERRERVADLETEVAKLLSEADTRTKEIQNQKDKVSNLQRTVRSHLERIDNQTAALRGAEAKLEQQAQQLNNLNSLNARLQASGIRVAPQQRRR